MIEWKPEDPRPRYRGWASGDYLCICDICKKHYIGDKRSFECADCAYAPRPTMIPEDGSG